MPVQSKMGKFEGVLFAEGGDFDVYYRKIKKNVNSDKLKQFGVLNTPEDRAKFLVDLPEIDSINVEAATSIRNLEKALEFKEKGNDFFRLRTYGEAFKNYTQALQHCPVNEENPEDPINRDYSIMLANRSAAMDGAGLYDACIKDIDRSLKFGYPRELWYKIYKRKGHAAIKMKQYLIAKEALEIALKHVGRSDIKKEKDRDTYRMKIRKQMTVFNVTKTLYNCELQERTPSCLKNGEESDRGMSKKLKIVEDGGNKALVAEENIETEDVLVSADPYVAVVNVTGGRAGGKICPHKMDKMFNPIPCSFGSELTFGSLESRDEASNGFHKYEWPLLKNFDDAKILERSRLALRMITQIEPEKISNVCSLLGKDTIPEESLKMAVKTFNLNVANATDEEKFVSSVLGFYFLQNLFSSGYLPLQNKTKLSPNEYDVFTLLERAVLVALYHTKPIELLDIPKCKKDFMDETNEIKIDICGFGIYPDLYEVETAGTGPERHVIHWFLDKKLLISSFRRVEKGQSVCIVEQPPVGGPQKAPANDMITFRCANELCTCSFPLKENTKEKIITCPLDDCGIKTNIWERLKLIQRLKKDFAAAKEEFLRSDVTICKDILKGTIDEWDRIIVRPYKEIEQLQNLYVRSLKCEIGDNERQCIEGNQFGHLISKKHKINVMPTDEDPDNQIVTKTYTIK
eukprot:GFUD01004397.1.p1 GENE.GFUD01004397.1~~GFUD01004397.1.p1  ORF type:complete len:687 (+),score=157.59 GFUD01004397.1:181-2241(+)